MPVIQVAAFVARCDGCGREVGQGYGGREMYDTPRQAEQAATAAGWTVHPDGSVYCNERHP